ncbi:MAG: hypothetical protein QXO69_02515, partial [archaeon]
MKKLKERWKAWKEKWGIWKEKRALKKNKPAIQNARNRKVLTQEEISRMSEEILPPGWREELKQVGEIAAQKIFEKKMRE